MPEIQDKSLVASAKRIESIDILRGIVMVIMALDHIRDFFHITANSANPLDLETTTPFLYFTRWITHYCAPIFVFLTGISAYLQSLRKSTSELSGFLIKRGLWFAFMEITVICFALTFDPFFHKIPLQTIWAIGTSMVLLGFVVRLPFGLILSLGLLIVLGHNLLDYPEANPDFKSNLLWDLLHKSNWNGFEIAEGHSFAIVYPLLPWAGLMMLGYCTGVFYEPKFSARDRNRIFLRFGFGLLLLFFALRFANIYGDPFPWSFQSIPLKTFGSFMDVHKYPPSLMYMCITIGPALLLLTWLENFENRFTKTIQIYGRTAFFYYILHFYFMHFAAWILFYWRGHTYQQALVASKELPLMYLLPGEGFSLPAVYLIWIVLVAILFPICKWYDAYKTNHKEKWWLSYI